MIIFFGPAGSGKSVQGQMLAARNDWLWLSMGQLLRDTKNKEIIKTMQAGKLVSNGDTYEVIDNEFKSLPGLDKLILDGFPRHLDQAQWLINNQPQHKRAIDKVIVIDLPKEEIMKRLQLRARHDDTAESIEKRLQIYHDETYPILEYFKNQGIDVVNIDGTGDVNQVHDRVIEAIADGAK